MAKLGDIIEDSRIKIQAAIDRMTQASHEAGYVSGLDVGITACEQIQARAQSVQGKAACEAVAQKLREIREEMINNGGAVR